MRKVKQYKGVTVTAVVYVITMTASLATHAGAAGDRCYWLTGVIERLTVSTSRRY